MKMLEILKYTLPSLIVFLTAYLIIRSFVLKEMQSRKTDLVIMNQKTVTPLRLQAYERLTLFLERISPEHILMRVNKPGMSVQQLHSQLLASIRAEFEHNLSQQIYMTAQAWEVIKGARNNTIKLINTTAEKLKPDAPSLELSRSILERIMEMETAPSNAAIEFLKKEINQWI